MKTNNAQRLAHVALATALCIAVVGCQPSSDGEGIRVIPTFRNDPGWPNVPAQWRLGEVSSIAIDAQDNAWFLHRPWTLPEDEVAFAVSTIMPVAA